MPNLEIKLNAMNIATNFIHFGTVISPTHFDDLKDELEIADLTINGVIFEIGNYGYTEISNFLKALDQYENQPLEVIATAINAAGLIQSLNDVFDFCDNRIVETLVKNDNLTSLRDSVGEQWSQDHLERILEETPKAHHETLTNYFNHEQYANDLFINELNYVKHKDVEIVYRRRAI